MLFTGEYEHTIDAKHRLAIPADLRNRLDSDTSDAVALYLALGANGALWLWPEHTFEEMAGELRSSLVPDEELVEFEELFFSQAARLELDKVGRVRLPERLLRQAGLDQHVVILGAKDHLELRDRDDWIQRREQKLAGYQETMLRLRRAMDERRRLAPGDMS